MTGVTAPDVQRDGDTWALAWPAHQIAFGLDHLKETSDGLRAELTVESTVPMASGRLAGPVLLNLLSTRSQTETINKLKERVNGQAPGVEWGDLVTYTCALVAKQYRAPTPVIDLDEVETSAEVEYLLPGLLPADETTVLYGDGESAKSLTALRIAVSAMTGAQLPWLDYPTRRCNVMYLDWETNPRTVAGRLQRIAAGMLIPTPKIKYRQCFRSITDELPHIREDISKHKIGLVIVDSIGFAASGALVEDETARSSMNALRQMSPATRLVVAHVSAAAARDTTSAARPFGSAFFWNGMRSGLELRRSEEGEDQDAIELGMFHRKANDGEHHKPIGLSVMFDGRKGAIRYSDSNVSEISDLAARTPLSSRLRQMLLVNRRRVEDMAEELDVTNDAVIKALRKMPGVEPVDGSTGRGHTSQWGLRP